MFRPPWFDAVVQYQPPEPPKADKSNLQPIEFPEDRLLAVLSKKHPELWSNTVINLVPDDMGHVHYTHPASAFVARQKFWMSKGQTEEEAYQSVLDDWRRQRRFERIELQLAMLQAEERGADILIKSPYQQRFQNEFKEALKKRVNLEQQRRRERLESLLESRDSSGEKDPIDLGTLDTDVTQSDLESLLASDQRAQAHFGGEAATFNVEIERVLPRRGERSYEQFREFLEQEITPEVKAMLQSNPPDVNHIHFFKELDGARRAKLEAEARAEKEQLMEEEPEAAPQAPARSAKGGKLSLIHI